MVGHRCSVSNQKPKDGGGLTWSTMQREKTFEGRKKHGMIR